MPAITAADLEVTETMLHDDTVFEERFQRFLMAAREVVVDVDSEGRFLFIPIGWVVDLGSASQHIGPLVCFQTRNENEIKAWVLLAILGDVPLVPNHLDVDELLKQVFAELNDQGFEVDVPTSTGDLSALGPSVRLLVGTETLRSLQRSVVQAPELSIVQDQLQQERLESARAKAVLSQLDDAYQTLSDLLARKSRNEHDLQRCLTMYPAIFGPGYRRVLPKHRLGAEFEVDYALECVDGTFDVMEIEASTHKLYNKNGNPTAALVHAEQQVHDWLAWIERNSPYARSKLPGLQGPRGLVVIGRRGTLTDRDQLKLAFRNQTYNQRLTVLTFDDLLDRLNSLRTLLGGDLNVEP